jgi:hypothetical protein
VSGDATGNTSIDASQDVTLNVSVADDSHNHIISNVDGLQTALDAKAPLLNPVFTGTDGMVLPAGTIAQRPSSPLLGQFRFNTNNNILETYGNNGWILVGAKDGASYATAADNATSLYDLGIRGKGLFWIKRADGTPIQVYCDLDTVGEDGKAGWMLVASWSTASAWTYNSVSSSSVFSSTALNCFSSNFGNTNMQHMRIKVSSDINASSSSSEADWYYYWSSPIQWKTVWAAGSGANNHYNSCTGTNTGVAAQRNSLKQFNLSYNLKFSYKNTNQIWANLSDAGTSGCTGTEEWADWYNGLTTSGITLGVYSFHTNSDGTLAILPQGYTSDNTAGQDCSNNNAKYGYDDAVLCAWGGSSATDNMGSNTGTKGSNTNLWMWIK